jgi:hypothetical protein
MNIDGGAVYKTERLYRALKPTQTIGIVVCQRRRKKDDFLAFFPLKRMPGCPVHIYFDYGPRHPTSAWFVWLCLPFHFDSLGHNE